MSEPTIDEMLAFIDGVVIDLPYKETYRPITTAIRAILEQHRDIEKTELEYVTHFELAAIRAFVERVKKRAGAERDEGYMDDELAAMVAEGKE